MATIRKKYYVRAFLKGGYKRESVRTKDFKFLRDAVKFVDKVSHFERKSKAPWSSVSIIENVNYGGDCWLHDSILFIYLGH